MKNCSINNINNLKYKNYITTPKKINIYLQPSIPKVKVEKYV